MLYIYYYKNRVFPDFRRTRERIWKMFSLKPSRDQDGANRKKFSQIGPAVPEEIGREHTYTHANILLLYIKD